MTKVFQEFEPGLAGQSESFLRIITHYRGVGWISSLIGKNFTKINPGIDTPKQTQKKEA
jgi:hypothetical protein